MRRKEYLIDTNFILRFLLDDIPPQTERARKVFKRIEKKEAIGLVSILVINELIWILEHFYKKKRGDFLDPVLKLLSLRNIKVLEIKKRELIEVLEKMKVSNLDFTDLYLIRFAGKSMGNIASFDKKLLKSRLP